jgi:hypothetical protein
MNPTSSKPPLVRTQLPAPHTEAYQKREKRKERLKEELMRAPPTKGLLELIRAHDGKSEFMEVLLELVPRGSLLTRILPTPTDSNDQASIWRTFVTVIFAQAQSASFARAIQDSPHTFGLGEEGLRLVIEENRTRKIGRRRSLKGKIDVDYDWKKSTPHELPELASALGLTPEGLRKKCSSLRIRIVTSPISRRPAAISSRDAIRLLQIQAKRSTNRTTDVMEQLARRSSLPATLTKQRRKVPSQPINLFSPDALGKLWATG